MTYNATDRDGIVTFDGPGNGVPLVIVPGVMADAQSWIPVADALDTACPIFIVNRRGRTPSRPIGENYDVRTEIEDLASVVKSIGEPVHLFGWSYGGLIALETAAKGLPIRSLTAYEPVSRPFAPQTIQPILSALAQSDTDRAVEIINRDVSGFDQDYVEALRRTPVWPVLCRLAEPLGSEMSAIDRFEPNYAAYAEIRCSITLIFGEQNMGLAPYGTAFERFATAIPNGTVDHLAGLGHLAHINGPEVLARAIVQAIRRAENSDGV
ncbi:alpha/beta fold hydrolase [Rhizobium oryzicola]|uniref:Alpha/beta hydrolase n=1 Tax=Rhizobium oryzicola TaxID=1232668 RepID=A0ABT8T608_9HYPH|nr:alpha/beta hydrolase [Rhizobium oryzicola]MDO1585443.1 alpha/beta hydrolase [Rhizobium oryzicola]